MRTLESIQCDYLFYRNSLNSNTFSRSSRQGGPSNRGTVPSLDGDNLEHPPELPPRVVAASGGRSTADTTPGLRLSSNSNFDICSSRTDIETSM